MRVVSFGRRSEDTNVDFKSRYGRSLRIGNSQNIGITETFSWTIHGQNWIFNKKGLNRNRLTPCFYLVGRARVELATNGLKVRCSTKLS